MGAMLLVKATLLLLVALLGGRLLRRSAAASRHRFWSAAFAALLAMPMLGAALPALYVPVPARWQIASRSIEPSTPSIAPVANQDIAPVAHVDIAPVANVDHAPIARTNAPAHPAAATPAAPPGTQSAPGGTQSRFVGARTRVAAVLLAVWISGTIVASVALLLSLWRVFQLSRAAQELCDPGWIRAAADLSARLGLRTPPRLLTADVATPMAGGVWCPSVFLPRAAAEWTADLREVVLAHEISHVVARDALRHFAARLAVALYWFHPMVWIAARHACAAREEACDAAVLALGTRPSAYAQALLDLADRGSTPHAPAAALPIIGRSLLEKRLMAILSSDAARTPARRWAGPAVALTLVAVSIGAAQPDLRAAALHLQTTSVPQRNAGSGSEKRGAGHAGAGRADAPRTGRVVSGVPGVSGVSEVSTDRAEEPSSAPAQAQSSACALDPGGSFTGTMSTSESGGRTFVTRAIGVRGGDRIVQERVGDLNLCMIAERVGDGGTDDRPSNWLGVSPHVIMEVSRGARVQRLEIDRRGASARTTWRVGHTERPFDAAAGRWRDRMLAVLDSTWEISRLRGQESSLRGEISSIRGEESSLRGEISSLRGDVSSMHGQQSSVRGEASSLRGEISSIEGHLSSLRGEISSEEGAISSLNASRYDADATERAQIADSIARHTAEIERVTREIANYDESARVAAVEQRIKALDADGKVAEIENQIRGFDLDAKIAAIERKIRDLDVDGKTSAIERRITALDADHRASQIENRRDDQLKQLTAAIDAIR